MPKVHYQAWKYSKVKVTVKVKVNLSLSIPWKHVQGAKVYLYPLLTSGTKWRWAISLTPQPLYPQEKRPHYWIGGWIGPRASLPILDEIKAFCPMPQTELLTVHPTSQSLATWCSSASTVQPFGIDCLQYECRHDSPHPPAITAVAGDIKQSSSLTERVRESPLLARHWKEQ